MLRKPHFRAPNMLAQTQFNAKSGFSHSKSRVWGQWKSSEAISNHNVGFNCQGFDFRRHSI